jgi:hypothetical protein
VVDHEPKSPLDQLLVFGGYKVQDVHLVGNDLLIILVKGRHPAYLVNDTKELPFGYFGVALYNSSH